MLSEQEIEFKNLLTKEEFMRLTDYFHIKSQHFKTQTNYYYDTPDQFFKNNHMGFRLRVMENQNELTLKSPVTRHVMNEQTILITDEQRDIIINQGLFPSIPFIDELIASKSLTCFGSIKTNRAQLKLDEGILFLDHSSYSRTEDYELEYESKDVEKGKKFFDELLKNHQIPLRSTDKKIARLVKAMNSLKG
ncbi:MAG: CYTH domain-containing protein [Psychrobacillus sp.]